ncbi:MAG: hypothetical protein JWR53_1606 [Glaciihabitans sp.]|nr:hypothetical protein [Glaciihabitans sp.]
MTTQGGPATKAADFQQGAKRLLTPYHEEVALEWFSAVGASDSLRADARRYAPRVDIAVGPYNTSPGRAELNLEQICEPMKPWFYGLEANPHPRCLVAIEVVFSGSAKHLLGDILNASALGLFGLIVCREDMIAKVRRNRQYLSSLSDLGKLPELFRNVKVVSVAEFEGALRG